MSGKILFVDDEEHVLRGLERQLSEDYDLVTAVGPYKGLEALEQGGPFSLVVADMRMPGMDGVTFLKNCHKKAPTTVRMMLTGNADQETAVQAVNEGAVFRFLSKPATPDQLRLAINDGLTQHKLIVAEKELLEKTLAGSIRVLVEILGLVDGASFGKAQRLKTQACEVAQALGMPEIWHVELAAMLAQVGSIAIPASLAAKKRSGAVMPEVEASMLERIPLIGANLISNVPRLESVAAAVKYQDKHFDGKGVPNDDVSGDAIPMASRILKVLKDFAELEAGGTAPENCFSILASREGYYDPNVLAAATLLFSTRPVAGQLRPVEIGQLKSGMVLGADVYMADGVLLLSCGQVVSDLLIARLHNFESCHLLKGPLTIRYPDTRLAA